MGYVACTVRDPLLLIMLNWREASPSLRSPISLGLPMVISVGRNRVDGIRTFRMEPGMFPFSTSP